MIIFLTLIYTYSHIVFYLLLLIFPNKFLIFELNCIFDEGRVILKNSGFSLELYQAGASKYFSGYKELFRAKSDFNTVYRRDFMVNAVKHLLECVDKKMESISSGADGLESLKLIEASMRSAHLDGKRIYIKRGIS